MIRLFLVAFISSLLISCSQKETKRPETALDTGREFIRASLDGDFKHAETLLLKDTQNLQLFSSYKTYYQRLPEKEKQQYKTASYNINKYDELNDSTCIINYSNSYMKKPMDIKLVRVNNLWDVDFKFMYAVDSSAN
ncbi:MAG: hypothetical protein JWQ27_700 [Ferruginibacter sp.]|nr:hypothetical protein [Ferruginibacter sp.]